MKLRSGKIIGSDKQNIINTNNNLIKKPDDFKNTFDFMEAYNKIKSKHSFESLQNNIINKNIYNMIEICNLYLAFIVNFNKINNQYISKNNLCINLYGNSLINIKSYKGELDSCLICRCLIEDNEFIVSCKNNHYIHLECFYAKIINRAYKNELSFNFDIFKEYINCGFCSSPLINIK